MRHARYGAGGLQIVELAVEGLRNRALQNDYDNAARLFRDDAGQNVYRAFPAGSGRADLDTVLSQRGAGIAKPVEGREKRAGERRQVLERHAAKRGPAGGEELLRSSIGLDHVAISSDGHHRARQRLQHQPGR